MFPSMIERRQNKRSLRELVRGAMDTALELVTLGEAAGSAPTTPAPAPTAGHPHPILARAVDVSKRADWPQLSRDVDQVRAGDVEVDVAGYPA